ncbi:hypothetical protein QBC32DRAFT_318687 [Pseudoneurospora amorphoporcata]|uniref:Uncharacterized protein n=1 Tax=Pseudoneurospora amorphoporcata TaxID=241081 RepID=A0AAN6SBI5_9PEZI|nr:hypothetical protein QBC32DRAFT_318687 [Pseudoneurospora amorphoporcata]
MDSQIHTNKNQDQQNPSGYEPIWPKDLDLSLIPTSTTSQFITSFFQVSDNPDLTEEWLSFFHKEAKLVMGDKVAEGKEEIRTLRKGMWEKVKARKHTVQKVFPAFAHPQPRTSTGAGAMDDDVLEFMVYGTVDYTLRETETGEEKKEEKMDWAAHAKLIRRDDAAGQGAGDGEASKTGNTSMLVFNRYRVYLSPSVE